MTFWGVRGSIPVPGRSTIRYGGNTACVSVQDGDTIIVFDAGSGIRGLGSELMARRGPLVIHLFVTHTHWDHIQGFPFFAPAYVPGNEVWVYGASILREGLMRALESQMDERFFPVSLEEMGGGIHFVELESGSRISIDDLTVSCTMLTHPGVAFGYRVDSRAGSVCYITDWEPLSRYCSTAPDENAAVEMETEQYASRLDEDVTLFCQDADLMIVDSQYDCEEYEMKRGWGHGCVEDAVAIALGAGIRRLALFHHDPLHDDKRIDEMVRYSRGKVREAGRRMEVFGAREGKAIRILGTPAGVPMSCNGKK